MPSPCKRKKKDAPTGSPSCAKRYAFGNETCKLLFRARIIARHELGKQSARDGGGGCRRRGDCPAGGRAGCRRGAAARVGGQRTTRGGEGGLRPGEHGVQPGKVPRRDRRVREGVRAVAAARDPVQPGAVLPETV